MNQIERRIFALEYRHSLRDLPPPLAVLMEAGRYSCKATSIGVLRHYLGAAAPQPAGADEIPLTLQEFELLSAAIEREYKDSPYPGLYIIELVSPSLNRD